MAIQFILEDGTGLTNSTTYVSVEEFKQYFENRGKSFTDAITTIQGWLNEATSYADNNYNWGGEILTEDQSLDIPRSDWEDARGRDISESVPVALKNGVCELAFARKGATTPSIYDGSVQSKSIGKLSKTFRATNGKSTTYPAADQWFNTLTMQNFLGVCRT